MTKQKAGQNNLTTAPGFYHAQNSATNDTKLTTSEQPATQAPQKNGTNDSKFTTGGVILLHKPRELSSNTAVNIVKRAVGASKAGHLGTLDVEAEGLLPITLNSATKLFDMFLHKDKEYLTTIKFGEERDSFDLEGELTRTDDKTITPEMINAALPALIGKQMQMPPAYSAKKIGGQKAYDLVRKGEQPQLTPKEVTVYDFRLEKQVGDNLYLFRIACSSGTYVRALCRDLAQQLSTCAVCYDITRTRCGIFDLKDAQTLDEIKNGNYNIICPDALFDCERISLSPAEINKLLNGQFLKTGKSCVLKTGIFDCDLSDNAEKVPCCNLNSNLSGKACSGRLPDGDYRLYNSQSHQFVGICNVKNGLLKLALRLN